MSSRLGATTGRPSWSGRLAGLAVICIFSVLAFKVLGHNRPRQMRCLRVDTARNERHLGKLFEHAGMVDGACGAIAPGEHAMAPDEDHRCVNRLAIGETRYDLPPGLGLVVA